MWVALGALLPLAVAMAISSVPIMVTIALLLSPNRDRTAAPFLIGWVAGMAAVLVGCIALASLVPVRTISLQPDLPLAIAIILVGVGLVGLAFVGMRRASGTTVMPRWLSAMNSLGPVKTLGLALILNFRPKALLLSAAAGLSLRGGRLTLGETAILVAVFTVVATSTVVGPIVFSWASPTRAGEWLLIARRWIERNNAVVTFLILLLIGVVVIGDGLSRM